MEIFCIFCPDNFMKKLICGFFLFYIFAAMLTEKDKEKLVGLAKKTK